jgi:hypothetical protein
MRAIIPIVFGRNFNDTPQPVSVSGQTGWFSVPRQWFSKPNPDRPSELIVSPNQDYSQPVYYACIADDMMTMAFQDLYTESQMGGLNPGFRR